MKKMLPLAVSAGLAGCTPANDRAEPASPVATGTSPNNAEATAPITPDSDIQPSPVSPPAEVDPVRNDVGNETPG